MINWRWLLSLSPEEVIRVNDCGDADTAKEMLLDYFREALERAEAEPWHQGNTSERGPYCLAGALHAMELPKDEFLLSLDPAMRYTLDEIRSLPVFYNEDDYDYWDEMEE